MDETWIHHYVPESNRLSAEWRDSGESRSKRVKASRWAGKVFASVFWDGHGIIHFDYLKKGEKCNKEYYSALLDRNQPRQSRPQNKGKYFLFASEQLHQALMGTSMCFAGERASGHNRNLDSGQWQTL
ncbi:hypothetical protein ACLKA6_017326 [Drosophila palustris]